MNSANLIKEISFDITYDCKLRCLHCSNDEVVGNKSINLATFKHIFNEISRDNDLRIVEFGGGEPFLHEQFYDMVQHISPSIQEIIIYTSGCIPLLNKKQTHITKSCACSLRQLGITQVNLTVHSHISTIHNYISNFKNGLENVFFSIKNLNQQNINVCIHIVVTQLNVSSLEETMSKLENSFNIFQFRLLRFVPQGTGAKNRTILELDHCQFNAIEFISSLSNQIRRKTTVAGYPSLFKCRPYSIIHTNCAAGREFIHVLPDGTIIPCPAFKGVHKNNRLGLSLDKFIKNDYNWDYANRRHCWGQNSIRQKRKEE